MATPLYSLSNVRQSFNGRIVLNVPDMVLEKGKLYGLLGPNGAGKTTLMRLLAFLDTPMEGRIFFTGQEVTANQRRNFRARVVWVPQTPVLFTGSLLYNVEYPMRLKRTPRQQRRARAMELLESVGLAHLAQTQARRLSGGEAQRGSIARALAAGAEVILFDEPTANVDYRSRGEIMRIIHNLWKERGLSLIVTTHDKALADELTQEEITLFEGEVVMHKSVAREDAASAEN
ncbi:ATP-binding cassette domain-containing protein [Desulfovibrio sp. OttesenSCG-928-M16]|nr:ATP-binding cassette domain-containing protein [Desulfovibrio sp. OttesenSCG-928-M16]